MNWSVANADLVAVDRSGSHKTIRLVRIAGDERGEVVGAKWAGDWHIAQCPEVLDVLDCIKSLIDKEPVEDAVEHPAESILENLLASPKSAPLVRPWLETTYLGRNAPPAIIGDFLELLARMPSRLVHPWGARIAGEHLEHPSLQVRAAAVRCFEEWGIAADCVDALRLRQNREPDSWLRSIIGEILGE